MPMRVWQVQLEGNVNTIWSTQAFPSIKQKPLGMVTSRWASLYSTLTSLHFILLIDSKWKLRSLVSSLMEGGSVTWKDWLFTILRRYRMRSMTPWRMIMIPSRHRQDPTRCSPTTKVGPACVCGAHYQYWSIFRQNFAVVWSTRNREVHHGPAAGPEAGLCLLWVWHLRTAQESIHWCQRGEPIHCTAQAEDTQRYQY